MRRAFVVITMLLLSSRLDAAPIFFTSQGSVDGFLLNPDGSATFSAGQSAGSSSWSFTDGVGLGPSYVRAAMSTTVGDFSVEGHARLEVFVDTPPRVEARGSATGLYSLMFDLTDPMEYELSGLLIGAGPDNQMGLGNVRFRFDGGGLFYEQFFNQGIIGVPVPPRGLLPTGSYTLFVLLLSSAIEGTPLDFPIPGRSLSGFDFTLELSPVAVPEPASLLLVGGGLAITALRRRRIRTPF
jgi:hypothetical protein